MGDWGYVGGEGFFGAGGHPHPGRVKTRLSTSPLEGEDKKKHKKGAGLLAPRLFIIVRQVPMVV
ncbi:hypothetical protein GCM10011529_20600 [Polymorphobacter glacialis]|uniref:Uncharacterized protein n=1 Tax=Sandarakinorhabdus glacialis TaxID=1614636 RepID=A0A916ZVX3_9SPHN|nr:hypothetical protein GCM10011529_20600 [Polymorphobacter glacialis]